MLIKIRFFPSIILTLGFLLIFSCNTNEELNSVVTEDEIVDTNLVPRSIITQESVNSFIIDASDLMNQIFDYGESQTEVAFENFNQAELDNINSEEELIEELENLGFTQVESLNYYLHQLRDRAIIFLTENPDFEFLNEEIQISMIELAVDNYLGIQNYDPNGDGGTSDIDVCAALYAEAIKRCFRDFLIETTANVILLWETGWGCVIGELYVLWRYNNCMDDAMNDYLACKGY